MTGYDVFFITYDEPLADSRWQDLKEQIPWAKRVHGITGFDAAYKACAAASSTQRFFTIDGDNALLPEALGLSLDQREFPDTAVLSWAAKNSVNGLCYGNGGIKNWPKNVALEMRTHELTPSGVGAVDFCFQLNYLQMPQVLSTTQIHLTPYHAFRAGFREGVKMCLERGRRPDFPVGENAGVAFRRHVSKGNLDRLRIWCSVGADRENGPWSMYGARLACHKVCFSDWDYNSIRSYDWFHDFWIAEQEPLFRAPDNSTWEREKLTTALIDLGETLNRKLGLEICELTPAASIFFKSVYVNPPRQGLMFKP